MERRNASSDLAARIFAAVPAIAFAIAIVWAGGIVWTIGLIGLGVICLHELYAMFDRAHPARLAGFLAIIGMALAAHYHQRDGLLLALVLTIPLTFFLVVAQRRGGAPAISVTMLGIVWIGLAIGHAVMLRDLPHGNAIVVDVLVGTFLGDTGAYLGGRAIGSTPLAPRISPNKTWEGLGVGIIVAVIATWCAGLYQDWLSGSDALLIGVAVGLAAPLGDLFESQVKRDSGVKDTGKAFGAHGGALDRLDAAFFTLVAGYYVWLALL